MLFPALPRAAYCSFLPVGLFLAPLAGSIAAADLVIEGFRPPAGNQVEIRFTANSASYYRLLRGATVTNVTGVVAVGLQGPLTANAATEQGFFRLEQLARSAAADTDGDGRDDVAEIGAGTNPLVRDEAPLGGTQFTSSPGDGEDGVAVTRETVLRFSRPLAEDTLLGAGNFFAEAAGTRVLARTELAGDRRTATLFYLEPLPGGTEIRVAFDGDKVWDAASKPVDADRDGTPGGAGFVIFTTLNNQPVPRTAVIGRVFASELVAGPDTGTNALNRPLAGVTVTVDGQEENLRAVTDGQGNFQLTNAPAGTFFVHVDGRTAVGSQWPDGDYYPFVGKAWTAVAGRADNLAGGNGEVYLPLIRAGSLQPVSATLPTTVTFPSAVIAANPALAGVELLVPPGALFDDNGARGGRVGIAPVPPDRLPEPLPDGLNFPLVITIQTDGPRNFAQPVPVRFPNLPDPTTGVTLPPAAKTALWSFDHDKGYWEIVGPATVTADGNFVDTDPGVGVLQPGWHGVQPGVETSGGAAEKECESEGPSVMGPIFQADLRHGQRRMSVEADSHTPGIVNWFCATAQVQGLAGDVVDFSFCEPGDHVIRAVLSPDCRDSVSKSVTVRVTENEVCSLDPLLYFGPLGMGEAVEFVSPEHSAGTIEWIVPGGKPSRGTGDMFRTVFCSAGTQTVTRKLRTECGRTCEVTEQFEVEDRTIAPFTGCFTGPAVQPIGPFRVGVLQRFYAPDHVAGRVTWECPDGVPSTGSGDSFTTVFSTVGIKQVLIHFVSECGTECTFQDSRLIEAAPAPNANPALEPLAVRPPASILRVTGPELPPGLPERATEVNVNRSVRQQAAGDLLRSPVKGSFYFVLKNLETGRLERGRRDRGPVVFPRPRVLRSQTRYEVTVATADGRFGGSTEFTTGEDGSKTELGRLTLGLLATDTDGDGLPDEAEAVLGSDPARTDTDGDGISDAAEALAGTPVNGAAEEPLGVVKVSDTPGYAWDVTVLGNLVAVADGPRGVSVFNVVNPENPALVGLIQLPGEARRIAGAGTRLLVGLGSAGVAVVHLEGLPSPGAPNRITFDAPVTAVAVAGDLGFVGLANGRIATVDLGSGSELTRTFVSGPVEDLLVSGEDLFVLMVGNSRMDVASFKLEGTQLSQRASISFEGSRGAGGRLLRLGLAGNRLYATHTAGVAMFEVRPFELVLLANQLDGQFGWRQLAPDATGRALAAADPFSTDDGAHDVQTFDLRPNGAALSFDTQYPTAGSAEALALSGNFAFVADGTAGLAVIRHAVSDRFGRPPTVRLRSPFTDGQAEEGRLATFVAEATDDVGVARVEFFVDGVPVGVDPVAPFELPLLLPRRSDARPTVRLRARATDTGGNAADSSELVLSLTGDASAPFVQQVIPGFGATFEGGRLARVGVIFNEPLNSASVTANLLTVVEAGPDGEIGTADDVPVLTGRQIYQAGPPAVLLQLEPGLTVGRYQATLEAGAADPAGNVMSSGISWTFKVLPPRVLAHRPSSDGKAAGRSVEVTFSAAMDPGSVALGFTVVGAGLDGVMGTGDDVPVAGTLALPVGSTVARLDFSPPLQPGRYQAVLSPTVTDLGGNALAVGLEWIFDVSRLDLGTAPLNLAGSLKGSFASDEYLLVVSGDGPVAVSNPRQLTVTLVGPNGEELLRDNRLFFKTPLLLGGTHLLKIAKGEGDFSENYTLQIARVITQTLAEVLSGAAAQDFTGPANASLGQEDVWELTAEAGASYFLEALGSAFPCPFQWTVLDPARRPALLEVQICTQPAVVVSAPQGGVIRVRFDALRNGGQSRLRVTRAQVRNHAVTLAADETYSSGSDTQFHSKVGRLNPGDAAAVAFTLPVGSQFSFNRQNFFFGPALLLQMFGPGGVLLAEDPAGQVVVPDTGDGGIFTLFIRNNSPQALTLALAVRPVLERQFGPFDLAGGAVYRSPEGGSISGPASRDVYTLKLPGGVPVAFGVAQFSGCHSWTLVNAAGQTIFSDDRMCVAGAWTVTVPAGEYRLIITGTLQSTEFNSGYEIVAGVPGTETTTHDLSEERKLEFRESLPLPGSRRVFEFNLAAAEVINLRFDTGSEGCHGKTSVRLLAPDGTDLLDLDRDDGFSDCNVRLFQQLSQAGRYRLEIQMPADERPEDYSFAIERARQADGRWLDLTHERNPLTGAGTALLVRNEGAEVFVAGQFADGLGVARRVGDGWEILGLATRDDTETVRVKALAHDGASLYAAGNFTRLGGVAASGVARWDGTAWQPLGGGITVTTADFRNGIYEVRDLAFMGTTLYAGGMFRESGGVGTFNLSRWNGTEWSKVTGPQFNESLDGVGGQRGQNDFLNEWVESLAVVGETLYVAGSFQFPGNNVGAWRDNHFKDSLGGGVDMSNFNRGSASFVRAAGDKLYFQGDFGRAGRFPNVQVEGFAAWIGQEWTRGPTRLPGLGTSSFRNGDFAIEGDRIAVGGGFDFVYNDTFTGAELDSTPAQGVALWDGTRWQSLGLGVELARDDGGDGDVFRRLRGAVERVQMSGRKIFVTGPFTHAGGQPAPFYAVWESAP